MACWAVGAGRVGDSLRPRFGVALGDVGNAELISACTRAASASAAVGIVGTVGMRPPIGNAGTGSIVGLDVEKRGSVAAYY